LPVVLRISARSILAVFTCSAALAFSVIAGLESVASITRGWGYSLPDSTAGVIRERL
jgi:hypothetical protein